MKAVMCSFSALTLLVRYHVCKTKDDQTLQVEQQEENQAHKNRVVVPVSHLTLIAEI